MNKLYIQFLGAVLLLLQSGCAQDRPVTVPPVQAAAFDKITNANEQAAIPTGRVTLQKAIDYAVGNSPRIKSANAAVRAAEGSRMQSDLRLNPEIDIQAENFAGIGHYNGIDSLETTYGIAQVIETGGKRSGRKAVAEHDVAISRHERVLTEMNVKRDATVAYANAIAAQQMLKLAEEQKETADKVLKEVTVRVDAAREPLIQKNKAQIAVAAAKFARERAKRELNHAKHILSNLWGVHDDDFSLDGSDFFRLTAPLTEKEAETKMRKNPAYKRMDARLSKMKSQYELEKSNAVPNPRVNAGIRDMRDTGDQAFVLGVSIPIPIFNANQGNIERARQDISKAESDKQAVRLAIINDLHEALETQLNAYRNADHLKNSILPSAQKAFALSLEGYLIGKLPYLEVLDAQRTLFDVKEQSISALKDYHVAKAEVDRLTTIVPQSDPAIEVKNEK